MTTPIQQSIWLETSDGAVHEVELETAMLFPFLRKTDLQNNQGLSKTSVIALPNEVNSGSLELILQFCRFHEEPGHSYKECKIFNKKFFKLELSRLCELAAAAWSLEMNLLIDLVSWELGKVIGRMTDEEFTEAFKTPDKSRRSRLIDELYARKYKGAFVGQSSSSAYGHRVHRSIDVEPYIDGTGKQGKRTKRAIFKEKKKTKEQAKDLQLADSRENKTESAPQSIHSTDDTRQSVDVFWRNQDAESSGNATAVTTDECVGDYDDDDSDLERKEEINRDVEEFERRLLLRWPDRVQEIFALASESQAGIRSSVPLVSSDSESSDSEHAVQSTHPQEVVQHGGGSVQEQRTKSSSQCTFGRFLFISIILLLLYFLVYS